MQFLTLILLTVGGAQTYIYHMENNRHPYTLIALTLLTCLFGLAQFGATPTHSQNLEHNQPSDPAKREIGSSGFLVPRFESLSVSEANMRVGPKQTHPIAWVYLRKGLPLEIIQEYESWRRVRDIDGVTGWMHKRLLNGPRAGIIIADWASIRLEPTIDAMVIIRAERGVSVGLDECGLNWCLATIKGTEGWIEKAMLWGVYPSETFD
jgi:SH3-like domain-containing protein